MDATSRSKREHLYELLVDFDTAMVITRTGDGRLHARPMVVAQLQPDADAYFVTSMDSPKVREIVSNPDASLTFQSSTQYAALSGRMTVVRDPRLMDKLWKDAWKAWFAEGKDDPDIVLLKFEPNDGEFWDRSGMKGVRYAFEAARSRVTGERPRTDKGQHGRVRL